MAYRLRWDTDVYRHMVQLSEGLRREVIALLLDLRYDPYPSHSSPLTRELARWRKIRVDGYRIIYRVDEEDKIIFVRDIRPRSTSTYLNL